MSEPTASVPCSGRRSILIGRREFYVALAALGGLFFAGCGEPAASPTATATTADPATPASPVATDAASGNSQDPAQPATAGTAVKEPPPPPPPPPELEKTVDEDQLKAVRRWLDETLSGDEPKAQAAIDNLKKMGNLAALPLAEIVAQDSTSPARQVAAMDQMEMLKFLNNPRAIEVVLAALEGSNLDLKQRAIGICGRQKWTQAKGRLKAIMLDEKQAVLKQHAAQALVQLGDEDAMALATSQLQSEDAIKRSRAVYMIRKQGDAKNLSLLAPLAADKDRDVRVEVVEACGDLGGVEAVRVLGLLLEDTDHVIVRDSCKHLKRITGVNIGRDPEKWKSWLKDEFEKKGEKAFAKGGGAAAQPKEQPQVRRRMQADPTQPPTEADGLNLGDDEQ